MTSVVKSKPAISVTLIRMAHENIVALLIAERDKLTAAITLLQGETGKRIGRPRKTDSNVPDWVLPKKPKRKTRKFTAKQRREQAARATAMWAKRRAAKAGKKKAAKAA